MQSSADFGKAAGEFKWRIFTKIKCIILAEVYHLAVSKIGSGAFESAQDEHCKWQQCCEQ